MSFGSSWDGYSTKISTFSLVFFSDKSVATLLIKDKKSIGSFSKIKSPTSILEKSKILPMSSRSKTLELRIRSIYFFCTSVVSVSCKSSAVPMTAFNGVLISWLIVAKNVPLAAFAATAFFEASSSMRLDSSKDFFCLPRF